MYSNAHMLQYSHSNTNTISNTNPNPNLTLQPTGVIGSPKGNPLFLHLIQDFVQSKKPIPDYSQVKP